MTALLAALDDHGFAIEDGLLTPEECALLVATYDDDARFRKTVVMTKHGFGRGEYRYFGDPLPSRVDELREHLYERLVPCANAWAERLGSAGRFPPSLREFHATCVAAGQTLPTPLLLRYGAGDFNCLHQDLYGDVVFPLQVAILLDEAGRDFQGGEFVLVEQRPRMQSRAIVVPLRRGQGVVFPCRHRPRAGARGFYRTTVRHGVSELREGRRHTLGIIFHGARS